MGCKAQSFRDVKATGPRPTNKWPFSTFLSHHIAVSLALTSLPVSSPASSSGFATALSPGLPLAAFHSGLGFIPFASRPPAFRIAGVSAGWCLPIYRAKCYRRPQILSHGVPLLDSLVILILFLCRSPRPKGTRGVLGRTAGVSGAVEREGGETMRPVFCGNFDYDTRQYDLEGLFSKYGPIRRIDMKSGIRSHPSPASPP
jgi:hypothetical protein